VICTGHHTCDSVAETEIEYRIFMVELFAKARVSSFRRISENNNKTHPRIEVGLHWLSTASILWSGYFGVERSVSHTGSYAFSFKCPIFWQRL
jgi:hypothetical protein